MRAARDAREGAMKLPRCPFLPLAAIAVSAWTLFGDGQVYAQETVRIGFSAPITGPFAENGKQMARDAKPEALFAWVPGGLAGPFLRQYVERGLYTSGIRLIGTGDITDDAVVNQMGDPMLGTQPRSTILPHIRRP
jgi:hypothetical protein